jgi:DNA-binding MarR family transcriptional regulator
MTMAKHATTIRVNGWSLSAYRITLLQALYAYHYADIADPDARGRGCPQSALSEQCGGTQQNASHHLRDMLGMGLVAKAPGRGWLLTWPGYAVVMASGGVGPLVDAGYIMPTK